MDKRTFIVDKAPYVATIPMIVGCLSVLFLHFEPAWWLSFSLGIVFGYHIISVVQSTSYDKTDIRRGYFISHPIWGLAAMVMWAGIAVGGAWLEEDGIREYVD